MTNSCLFLSVAIIGFAFQAPTCAAFNLQHGQQCRQQHHFLDFTGSGRRGTRYTTAVATTNTKLFQSSNNNKNNNNNNNNNQFDVSKLVFDPLSLRSVRGDAIIRYDATNQSEPLRIVLSAFFGLISLSAPSLVEATGFDPMSTPMVVASVLLAAGSGGLFFRECTRRSRQLTRIEKELNTESLPIRLPTNPFSEQPFSRPFDLKQLKTAGNPPRIIALCGTRSKLTEALSALAVYRNRLSQASVFVVAVSTDGSNPKDWQVLGDNEGSSYYKSWLADSYQPRIWLEYFRSLTSDDGAGEDGEKFDFRWFGLNSNGRSFGSGDGEIQVIQLMGQFLRPADFLDASDGPDVATALPNDGGDDDGDGVNSRTIGSEKQILETLASFYKALTTGDQDGISQIYSRSNSKEVSEVIEFGGRIDSWKDCLAEGARPSGMRVSGADVTIVSDTVAYTTCIEFPANTGMDSASLLAVQRFTRGEKSGSSWKLDLHQTIPWSLETKAQGTLQCDCRGCVALTRGRDRQTFGGLIG